MTSLVGCLDGDGLCFGSLCTERKDLSGSKSPVIYLEAQRGVYVGFTKVSSLLRETIELPVRVENIVLYQEYS